MRTKAPSFFYAVFAAVAVGLGCENMLHRGFARGGGGRLAVQGGLYCCAMRPVWPCRAACLAAHDDAPRKWLRARRLRREGRAALPCEKSLLAAGFGRQAGLLLF